jgi:hypothetical protein
VFSDPKDVLATGRSAFEVDLSSLPDGLSIFKTGSKPTHYEIGPSMPGMSEGSFLDALSKIRFLE